MSQPWGCNYRTCAYMKPTTLVDVAILSTMNHALGVILNSLVAYKPEFRSRLEHLIFLKNRQIEHHSYTDINSC